MKAAVPNVPPPVGIVKVAPAAGQVKIPAPPLLVKAVVKVALVTVAAFPSILVIPVRIRAALARFKATAVVPIYIVELLAALSPVFVPEMVAFPEIVRVLFASFKVKVRVLALTVKFSVLVIFKSKAPVPVERMPKEVRASTVPPLMSGVVRTGLASVPTVVREEETMVEPRVVPLRTVVPFICKAVVALMVGATKEVPK